VLSIDGGAEALEVHERLADVHLAAHLARDLRQILGSLQRVLDAQQQLAKMKRLADVIIGTELETVNAILGARVCGEEDDRRGRRTLAQQSRELKAVAVR